MTLLLVTVAIAVIAGVAILLVRDQPLLEDDPVQARALRWPPEGEISPEHLADARFTVALRGYRMDEVDRVLDDARAALAERDRRIARLEGAQEALGVLAPALAEAASGDPGGLTAPGLRPDRDEHPNDAEVDDPTVTEDAPDPSSGTQP